MSEFQRVELVVKATLMVDFEQQIIKCWGITDDIKDVSEHFLNYHESNFTQDRVANTLTGLAELYDIKFHKLWDGFEDVVMGQVKHIKMLEEECAALREQLTEATQCGAGKNCSGGAGQPNFKPVPIINGSK